MQKEQGVRDSSKASTQKITILNLLPACAAATEQVLEVSPHGPIPTKTGEAQPHTNLSPWTLPLPIIPVPCKPSAPFLINPVLPQATDEGPSPASSQRSSHSRGHQRVASTPGDRHSDRPPLPPLQQKMLITPHPLFTCISRGLCKQKSPRELPPCCLCEQQHLPKSQLCDTPLHWSMQGLA